MRPIEPLVETLTGAFAPLQCGVDLVGRGETVRLHVFDDDHGDLVRRAWPLALPPILVGVAAIALLLYAPAS